MFEGQYYFGFVVFTLKAKIFGHSWRPKILTSDIFWHPKFVMCEIFCNTEKYSKTCSLLKLGIFCV